MSFGQKQIAIGVSGGIAAYKACEFVRELKRRGAAVRVAMTRSAENFVSALTFATLSENPVVTSLFNSNAAEGTAHIDMARWCDLLVLCPATANLLAKSAMGIADDFVTTTILATDSPVIFCPAMNSAMWRKPVVQGNIASLKESGYRFVEPEWGELATRSEGLGWGRLATIPRIVQAVKQVLTGTTAWAGKKVLVTAGPTREAIDPVRFITNHSTAKMGFALAESAKLRGADVTLIAGPNCLEKIDGVTHVEIETATQLNESIDKVYAQADLLLMAAAVSDYKPTKIASHKLKKSSSDMVLELKRTEDILASLAKKKKHCVHVGFALETDNEMENAAAKLLKKSLDLIVLNNPLQPGAAFGGDTNVVTILSRNQKPEKLPKLSKTEVAEHILDRAELFMRPSVEEAVAV